ncbi:MAG: hypothetical protein QOJ35_2076 [Solirubrobacteraceae bacterium]|nr:hypothetical protein [Solirubrobacteraceae bacterium]
MIMRPLTLVALLTFALAAVPIAAGKEAIGGPSTDPGIADGSKQRRLDRARRDWRAAGLRSYRYMLTRTCYCPPLARTIVVHAGRPAADTPKELADEATVPRLFRRIQRAIDAKVARISVTYGRRGVPRSIYVDVDRRIADEEIGYEIGQFTPLKR